MVTATQQTILDPESLAIVYQYRTLVDRKFDGIIDIANGGTGGNELYRIAEKYLTTLRITPDTFPWLAETAARYIKGGGLSDRQAAGVLNCLYNDMVRQMERESRATTRVVKSAQPALDDDDTSYEAWLKHEAARVSRGFYTLVHEGGNHHTLKVGQWKPDSRNPSAKMRWIGLLIGSNNTGDYLTVALQREDGEIVPTRNAQPGNVAMVSALLTGRKENRDKARVAYALESGNCARCNRVLTHPESIEFGLGPECREIAF
jgi:hypothetical protein